MIFDCVWFTGAAEVSALTPGLPTRAILTPISARTPRRSPRLAGIVNA